jgi:hypothetical protein
MRTFLALAAAAFLCSAANKGLPARNAPADYPAHGESKGIVVAAECADPDQVRGSFATDLTQYTVCEVAVYPKKDGTALDLQNMDFAMRADGRMVRPVAPRSIAAINQRKGQARSRDVTLYPTVGVTTGTWGTGTMVGVGVGMGGNAPGPASSDTDRRVMEQELEDKSLPDAVITKPVAGYLYFPVAAGKRRADTYVLEYQSGDAEVKLTLTAPKTK